MRLFISCPDNIPIVILMDDNAYREAQSRVRGLKGFYTHLTVYILANTLLIIINLVVSPHQLWFYWVTIFWGTAVLVNAAQVFAGGRFLGKDWEERKIEEYMKDKEEK